MEESRKSLQPLAIKLLPSWTSFLKDSEKSSSSALSILIKYFMEELFSAISSILFAYLSENITASALDFCKTYSISVNGSSLSRGTTTPTPFTVERYVTDHS